MMAGDIRPKAAGLRCAAAVPLLLLPACLWQACMHVASALCHHVPGRPSSSLGARSEIREGAAQKHKHGVLYFYFCSARVPGRRKLLHASASSGEA